MASALTVADPDRLPRISKIVGSPDGRAVPSLSSHRGRSRGSGRTRRRVRYQSCRRDSTVPRRRHFLPRPAPGVPRDGRRAIDCVRSPHRAITRCTSAPRALDLGGVAVPANSHVSARVWAARVERRGGARPAAGPPWRALAHQGSCTTPGCAADARAARLGPRIAPNSTIAPSGQIVGGLCAARAAPVPAVRALSARIGGRARASEPPRAAVAPAIPRCTASTGRQELVALS